MVYTKLTAKAMRIALRAHRNQFDKNEFPYVHHPLHIAEQMQSEDAVVVALLHDVLEDSKYTAEDLLKDGIPTRCVEAIQLLTRVDGSDYMDYINSLKDNRIALIVKRADLLHNMDPTRRIPFDNKYESRTQRYQKALELVETYIRNLDGIS
jgi:(p)ppGpp synthase/HD superfamily hydrolase